jgi:hypothetical protein
MNACAAAGCGKGIRRYGKDPYSSGSVEAETIGISYHAHVMPLTLKLVGEASLVVQVPWKPKD